MKTPVTDTTDLLAEGFGHHVRAWALRLGAPARAADTAAAAACAVSKATTAGHVCVLIAELQLDATDLAASRVVGTPEAAGAFPLVLDSEGRLYLHRYFDYERRLARRLADAAGAGSTGLSIVSGGPGTGKTTQVVHELAQVLSADPRFRVALAAPTGKAAARMTEAIRARAGEMPPDVQERLPKESFTIHRLLRYNPSGGFEHDAENPLPVDMLVVDEASMLDLALATRLLEAVPPGARIVLLGDKDQLSAVESGAVFAEISADRDLLPVTWLTKNHRFAQDSGIGRLAGDIRAGRADAVIAWLGEAGDLGDVAWQPDADPVALAVAGFARYLDAIQRDPRDVAGASAAFGAFRVLAALRDGPRGVAAINAALTAHAQATLGVEGEWHTGRPVIVLENDYGAKLFNGDIGLVLPDSEGRAMVHFPESTGWRAVPPSRLPRHETAFAMTVHKAQGSEFDEVLLVLPGADSRVVTRELVYTGVTRARSKVILCAGASALSAAIAREAGRRSGLRARLRDLRKPPASSASA